MAIHRTLALDRASLVKRISSRANTIGAFKTILVALDEWTALAEGSVDVLLAKARVTDLLVIGQSDSGEPDHGFYAPLVESVVFSAGRPSLVVPYIGAAATIAENVLVACNETRKAARALSDALPRSRSRDTRVDVMTVRHATEGPRVESDPETLRPYLERHGVRVGAIHGDVADDDGVGEWLLSRAADLGCDSIVMSAYAHARPQQRLLGGVTRTMLEGMTIPVLMSH
jgi:nucleotide-binding universal stress UspA family protein